MFVIHWIVNIAMEKVYNVFFFIFVMNENHLTGQSIWDIADFLSSS